MLAALYTACAYQPDARLAYVWAELVGDYRLGSSIQKALVLASVGN
jgi:hypothetical protein